MTRRRFVAAFRPVVRRRTRANDYKAETMAPPEVHRDSIESTSDAYEAHVRVVRESPLGVDPDPAVGTSGKRLITTIASTVIMCVLPLIGGDCKDGFRELDERRIGCWKVTRLAGKNRRTTYEAHAALHESSARQKIRVE